MLQALAALLFRLTLSLLKQEIFLERKSKLAGLDWVGGVAHACQKEVKDAIKPHQRRRFFSFFKAIGLGIFFKEERRSGVCVLLK